MKKHIRNFMAVATVSKARAGPEHYTYQILDPTLHIKPGTLSYYPNKPQK